MLQQITRPNGIENIGTPAVFIDGTNTQLQTLTDNAWYRTVYSQYRSGNHR